MPSFSVQLKPIKTPLFRARHHNIHLNIPRISPDDQLYTLEIATVAASTASVLTALWFQQQWQSHSNNFNTPTNDINTSDNDNENDIHNISIQTSPPSPITTTGSPWDAAWQALTTTTSSNSSSQNTSPPPPLTTPLFMLQAIKLSHRMHLMTLSLKSLQQHIQDNDTNTASNDVGSIIAVCARQVASQFTPYNDNSNSSSLMDTLDTSVLNDSSTWWPPLKERSTPYSQAVQICRRRRRRTSDGDGDDSSVFESNNSITLLQDEHCDLVLIDMAIMVAELVAAAIVTQSLPLSSSSSTSTAALVVERNKKSINNNNNNSNGSQGMQTSLRVVKRHLSNTRALQRFANQIILCRWVESTFSSVVNIVEDRLVLYKILSFSGSSSKINSNGVVVADNDDNVDNNDNRMSTFSSGTIVVLKQRGGGGGLLSTVAVPMKRTQELRNLSGLRFAVSLFLEASDLLSPLLNAFWRSALAGAAWLLVQFVGRALGLIWKGIKLSFDNGSGSGSSTGKRRNNNSKKSKENKKGGDDEYREEEGPQLPPLVWGGGGGGMWSPVY
jgi:hypothetical protein